MKKNMILKMKLCPFGFDWEYRGNDTLCKHNLADYFGIPEGTKEIHVKLSKRKTKDAYLIEAVERKNQNDPYAHIRLEKKLAKEILYYPAERILHRFGLPCYVSVEY